MKKSLLAILAFFVCFTFTACAKKSGSPSSVAPSQGTMVATTKKADDTTKSGDKLEIKMLDVGQGDAILIRHGGKTILVDAGDIEDSEKVIFQKRLAEEKVTSIDALILTHPHSDHMGGVDYVLKNIPVAMAYDNGQPAKPKFYLNYLKILKEKKIKSKTLTDGDIIDFGGGLRFVVLSPTKAMRDNGGMEDGKINLNLNSVEGRLEYGEFKMMFTGDGEISTEAGILKRYKADKLKSDILKSPHHGSKTSSSEAFLKAVNPDFALISCGIGNSYHHPHPSIRKRYGKMKIDYYRTDVNGTITVTTTGKKENGKLYQIKAQKGKKNDQTDN